MTDPDDWERVGRETLHRALSCLLDDADATVEPVADAVYWDHDVSAEEVEAMRQLAFDLEYATEAYLARLCEETEPWSDDEERTPSRLPAVESGRPGWAESEGDEGGEAGVDGDGAGDADGEKADDDDADGEEADDEE